MFIDLPELNPDVAGTHLPIGPTAYRNLVNRPTNTYRTISNEALYVSVLSLTNSVSICTCCIVFVVVYDIGYGVEGVFFSQEELSSVCYFDLVMPYISIITAHMHTQKTNRLQVNLYCICELLLCLFTWSDVNHLNVFV